MQASWWASMASMASSVASMIALVAISGCGFEGAGGANDAGVDTGNGSGMADARVDAPGTGGTATCEDSVEIGGSYYRLLPSMNQAAAVAACAAIPGTHLVTFEDLDEITAVVTAIPLTGDVWTGIEQHIPAGAGLVDSFWFNTIGGNQMIIPSGFPWSANEPNDYDAGETVVESGEEDFAMMSPAGSFDDVLPNRLFLPLCECKRRP